MKFCHGEPTLEQILSDPIVRALMDADGIDPHELEIMLKEVGRRLREPHPARFWAKWSVSSQQVAI
jgi:hypothetical protein